MAASTPETFSAALTNPGYCAADVGHMARISLMIAQPGGVGLNALTNSLSHQTQGRTRHLGQLMPMPTAK